MTAPAVSVVIPTLNEEQGIARTLASLFSQSLLPQEIIVADGGSSDRTQAVVRELGLSSTIPVLLVPNPHGTPGAGRNVGVEHCSSALVAFIDASNIADKRWLERLCAAQSLAPEPAVAAGRIVPRPESSFQSCVAAVVYNHLLRADVDQADRPPRSAKGRSIPSSSCLLLARTLWRRIGGYPEWLYSSEDRLFAARIEALAIPIVETDEAVVHFHLREAPLPLLRQFFRYGRGAALCWRAPARVLRLALRYGAAAILAVAAISAPMTATRAAAATVLVLAAAIYWVRRGWLPNRRHGGHQGALATLNTAVVLACRDLGLLLGHGVGTLQRLLDPRWRRRVRDYLP